MPEGSGEEGIPEEVLFEQSLEGQMVVCQMERWGMGGLGRENCSCVVMELSKEWTCSWNKGLSVMIAEKV